MSSIKDRVMNPTSKYLRIGITKLRQQSAPSPSQP